MKFKTVSKEEFELFIKDYRNPLTSGCTTICEPPFKSFRDGSIKTHAKLGSSEFYFDKEVARVVMDWLGPNGEVDRDNTKEFYRYWILA